MRGFFDNSRALWSKHLYAACAHRVPVCVARKDELCTNSKALIALIVAIA